MIDIKVSGVSLEIDERVSLNVEGVSPFILADEMPGLFSYPLTIPNTPLNRKTLSHPEQIGNIEKLDKEFPCSVFLDGFFWKGGLLKIIGAGKREYEATLRFGSSEISSLLNNTKLKNIDLGGDQEIPEIRPRITVDLVNTGTNLILKYIDSDYLEKINASLDPYHTVELTNTWDGISDPSVTLPMQDMLEELNALDLPIYAEFVSGTRINFFHKLYNWGALDNEFDPTNLGTNPSYDLASQLLASDSYPDEITKHMENLLVTPNNKWIFAPVKSPEFMPDLAGCIEYINYYRSGGFFELYEVAGKVNTYTPYPFLHHLLTLLFDHFGWTIHGDVFDSAEFRKIVLYNNFNLPVDVFQSSHVIGDHRAPLYINLANHVQDVSCSEFILELQTFLNVGFFFDPLTKRVELVNINTVPGNSVKSDITQKANENLEVGAREYTGFKLSMSYDSADGKSTDFKDEEDFSFRFKVSGYADLPMTGVLINDLALVITTRIAYKATSVSVGSVTWTFHAYVKDTYEIGDASEEIRTEFCETLMVSEADPNHARSWLIPWIDVKATAYSGTPAFQNGYNPCGLRLLIYQGLQNDSVGNSYPLLSNDVYNYAGAVVGSESLRYHTTYGIYEKKYNKWLDFLLKSLPYEGDVSLTLQDILSLEFGNFYSYEKSRFLLKSYSLTIKMAGIDPSRLKLLKR